MKIRSKIRGEGATGRTKVESLEYEKGHKNSKGEDAPWVIRDHKDGKILASFPNKKDAEDHLERMKHYAKSEVLDTAGFSLFVKNLLDAAINKFDDATWDRLVKDYDFGADFEKGCSVEDALDNMQGWVLATENIKENAMKNNMTEFKAAVSAAWSAANIKHFKIDVQKNEESVDIVPKKLDGSAINVNWRIVPEARMIFQYAEDATGNSDIEREIEFDTVDDVEAFFTDEFKELDAMLGKTTEARDIQWDVTVEWVAEDDAMEMTHVITTASGEEEARKQAVSYISDNYEPAANITIIDAKQVPRKETAAKA